MKKFRNILLILLSFFLLLAFFGHRYFNSGTKTADNSVWEAYIGRDTTVGVLPDKYANYFSYTLVKTNKDMGFRIKGEFPNARYMSFNVYSLHDNTSQGSLVDYQIETDSGLPNPFLRTTDSTTLGQRYTVHILPEKFRSGEFQNTLPFDNDVRFLLMIIRLYDYDNDDFGGVEYPTVEAFTPDKRNGVTELKPKNLPRSLNLRSIVRRFSLPKMVERLAVVYQTENKTKINWHSSEAQFISVPFHAINDDGFIENFDNRYLLAAMTKKNDEVFLFRFKPPSHQNDTTDLSKADVRYWSFNLGNQGTFNFNALKDEDALVDNEGYVNIVLAEQDNEIEARTAQLGYNFLEWNMSWQKGYAVLRHMLANPEFEAQIDNVPTIDENTTDFKATEASLYMGEYAPRGIRMSKAKYLSEFSIH